MGLLVMDRLVAGADLVQDSQLDQPPQFGLLPERLLLLLLLDPLLKRRFPGVEPVVFYSINRPKRTSSSRSSGSAAPPPAGTGQTP